MTKTAQKTKWIPAEKPPVYADYFIVWEASDDGHEWATTRRYSPALGGWQCPEGWYVTHWQEWPGPPPLRDGR